MGDTFNPVQLPPNPVNGEEYEKFHVVVVAATLVIFNAFEAVLCSGTYSSSLTAACAWLSFLLAIASLFTMGQHKAVQGGITGLSSLFLFIWGVRE